MHLKPPIPRMNSPNQNHIHHSKGCTRCAAFSHAHTQNKEENFMMRSLSQSIKPHWKRALSLLLVLLTVLGMIPTPPPGIPLPVTSR